MASATVVTVPEAASAGTGLNVNPTLEIRPPQPIYDPQSHSEGSGTTARAQHQSTEVSGPTAAAQTEPEPQVDIRYGDHHNEKHMDIAAGNAKQETTVESSVGRDIRSPTSHTTEDAVGPSLDA